MVVAVKTSNFTLNFHYKGNRLMMFKGKKSVFVLAIAKNINTPNGQNENAFQC
jgi:hypothetical protein